MRILVVESNPRAAKSLSARLTAEKLVVEIADTGEIALGLLRHYEFDLVLLNLDLPDMEGSTLISRIRAAGHHTPILALSNTAHARSRLKALSAGCDDVVEHDIDPAELLARMRAIVRRTRGYSNSLLRAGAVTLDVEQQEVLANGNRVHFTGKEFAILQLLMLRKNIVLTKETILSQLYNGLDEPEIKIIDVFVCKIRNKLANAGIRNVICTVWGRGYTIRDTGRDNDTSAAPRIPQPVEVSRLSRAFA